MNERDPGQDEGLAPMPGTGRTLPSPAPRPDTDAGMAGTSALTAPLGSIIEETTDTSGAVPAAQIDPTTAGDARVMVMVSVSDGVSTSYQTLSPFTSP